MSQTATQKVTCLYPDLLRPIDKDGLGQLATKGKANPKNIVTLKAKTVCEVQFRNLTYIRNLPAYVIDEPPHLRGEATAPNPSEATRAALGACLSVGVHANATARGVALSKLELEIDGDINVTAVWGVGDLDPAKKLGFTDIRVKITAEGDAPREVLDAIIASADQLSPVANTLRNPVNVAVTAA